MAWSSEGFDARTNETNERNERKKNRSRLFYLFREEIQALVPLGLERPLERRLRVRGRGQRQSRRPLVALGRGGGRGSGVALGVVGQARQLLVVDVAVLPLGHRVEREGVGELHRFGSDGSVLSDSVEGLVRSGGQGKKRNGGDGGE